MAHILIRVLYRNRAEEEEGGREEEKKGRESVFVFVHTCLLEWPTGYGPSSPTKRPRIP